MTQPGTDLIKRASIEEIVAHRNHAIAQHAIALEALEAAKRAGERACTVPKEKYNHFYMSDFEPRVRDAEQFRRTLDGAVWRALLSLANIEQLMDRKAAVEFRKQCGDNPPEVSVDNVAATIQRLMGDAGKIFQRSIINIFEGLPRSYKSHDGFKLGKRIILEYALETDWGWSLRYNGHDLIIDLDRIMHLLDGKEPTRDSLNRLELACKERGPFVVDSTYFRWWGFKKGTLHALPLREDLVVKANKILADHYGAALGRPREVA